ncbi:hypothetical protein WICPIJ_007381 [Wickerhamomyces pijperi]|uniref:RNA polymerase II subunit A C-terminal domain phosphatase n=1 Tax=Wickerhamomyces pijperi TaxID=599730 RepID=A0A9P8Q1R6_WICPI|nr:hypothetical protein WICPIJ_007381 [Wickerhamomyces pijperi]
MPEFTELRLHESIPFPVKVLSIDVNTNQTITKHQHILKYSYWELQDAPSSGTPEPGQHQKKKVRVDLIGTYESPIEGAISEILVNIGDEIITPDQVVLKVVEPCYHEVQFGGLCAVCGKSLEEETDYTGYNYSDRATISMSHARNDLKISKGEAAKIEEKMTVNLVKEKKLILVVDLDQTVIHVTVDPTIHEWMNDVNNVNYPSLKDVKTFTLEEEVPVPDFYTGPRHPPQLRNYYLKLRPGLEKFLETVCEKYEMHIYTMGTRAYAKAVAKCIDPDGKYFSDRILSRDESGSLTQKSLERLFPTDTSMVVIIDDRGDVWNWSDHLIKVVPFEFFVGIGDINSTFLPKQRALQGPSKRRGSIAKLEDKMLQGQTNDKESTPSPQSTIDGEDAGDLAQREAQLEKQEEQRPLAKLQQDLEKLEPESNHERLLYDDDTELIGLENALTRIHELFYEHYDSENPPDIKYLLPPLKQAVFKDTNFVFSGLLPLGSDINRENIVIWAKTFGAKISKEVDYSTTHLVTKNPFTYKAKLAKSLIPEVKIIHPNWIFDSMTEWKAKPTEEYELDIPESKLLPKEEVEKYKAKLQKEEEERAKTAELEEELNGLPKEETDGLLGGDMHWLDLGEEDEDFLNDSDGDDEEDENHQFQSYGNGDGDTDSRVSSLKRSNDGLDEDDDIEEIKRLKRASVVSEADEEDLANDIMLELDGDDDEE